MLLSSAPSLELAHYLDMVRILATKHMAQMDGGLAAAEKELAGTDPLSLKKRTTPGDSKTPVHKHFKQCSALRSAGPGPETKPCSTK